MTTITLDNIKPKFYPSIVNRDEFPHKDLKAQIEAIDARDINSINFLDERKPHVYEFPELSGYVVKIKHPNRSEDTLLYRVRKALKIQKIIEKYGFDSYVQVPKKYLFYSRIQKWSVIAEKMPLSDKVPQVKASFYNKHLADIEQILPEPLILKIKKGLSDEAQAITAEQANALATIIFEAHLTDLTLNNLFFTPDNKIAILDTEPEKRAVIKKNTEGSIISKLFMDKVMDKEIYKLSLDCHAAFKLKLSINDEKVCHIIDKVERYHLIVQTIKSVAKAAFLIIAYSYAAAIPIAFVPFLLKIATSYELATLFFQYVYLGTILYWCHQKDEAGLGRLHRLQQQGTL